MPSNDGILALSIAFELTNFSHTLIMKKTALPYLVILFIFTINHTSAQSPETAVPKLTPKQLSAVVTISGKSGSGTGFFCKIKGRDFVVTNQHVIAGNPQGTFKTQAGEKVVMRKIYATKSADIALLEAVNTPKSVTPLELLDRPETEATKNDLVVIPGNSKGGGVITETPGKLVAIGPHKIEVDNPVYPGNSGSPMIHMKTGKVIGVLTSAELISLSAFDKASFLNKQSAIKSEIRYFGHRVDTVKQWKMIKWSYFQENDKIVSGARAELNCLAAYYTGSSTIWKKFKNLHVANNRAQTILDSRKYSEANKIQAMRRLIRDFDSYTRLAQKRADQRELTYIHLEKVKTNKAIAKSLLIGSSIVERDTTLVEALIQREN